jgi:hypothetical protein
MSRQQKPAVDPVILMALGIGLLTIAIIMMVTQNQGEQGVSVGWGAA